MRQYFADYGLAGNLYNQLFLSLNKKIETTFAKDAIENGEINILSDDNTPANLAALPETKTKIDQTKIFIDNLSKLQNNDDQASLPPVPDVTKPHIIIYQLESVSFWPLKQEPSPMPYLKNLIENNVTVNHFLANSCQTINAEFSSLCGFFPDSLGPISTYRNNDYHCLPSLLKEKLGYKTQFFHANTSDFWDRTTLTPKWGFDELFFTPFFLQKTPDSAVLDEVVKKMKESDEPTFNYVVGFTSHDPHTEDFIDYYLEKHNLLISPYADPLNANSTQAKADEKTIRNYFGFLKVIDDGIKNLFVKLKENNLLDNTIVVIYGDHRYYNFPQDNLENFYNYNEIPFVIYAPNQNKIELQKFASHLDIAPTLLNLIEGEEYKKPNYFIGSSLFSSSYPNSVISKCLGEIIYLDPQIIIKGNSKTDLYQKFYPSNSLPSNLMPQYIENLKGLVKTSDEVIYTNALTKVDKGETPNNNDQLLGGYRFVAHALGEIDGFSSTNSFEAFQYNYGQGKRIFEVDLYTTKDNEVVALHSPHLQDLFNEDLYIYNINKKDFLEKKIYGKFTPLDLDQLLNLLNDHQDAFLIIDTKDLDNFERIYQQIVEKSKKINPAILDRIIPQIYYENNLEPITRLYNFQTIIYALYRIEIDPQEVLLFTQKNKNIKFITINKEKYLKAFVDLLKANDVLTFIHTLNDPIEINKYLDEGIYGIFTDSYTETHQ